MLANRKGAAHLVILLLVLLVVGLVVALSASKKTISFKPKAAEETVICGGRVPCPSPTGTGRSLKIKVQFEKITKDVGVIPVIVNFYSSPNGGLPQAVVVTTKFVGIAGRGGGYQGVLNNIPVGDRFDVGVKSDRHLGVIAKGVMFKDGQTELDLTNRVLLAGDINGGFGGWGDDYVTILDFSRLSSEMGKKGKYVSDLDYNGVVNQVDADILKANFGKQGDWSLLPVPTSIPTPRPTGVIIKTSSAKRGDCNGDGNVDAGDVSALALEIADSSQNNGNALLAGGGTFAGTIGCDVNYDRVVNSKDNAPLTDLIFNTPNSLPGDCNADGKLDAGDISAMALEIEDTFTQGNNPFKAGLGKFKGGLGCDVNYDGVINAADPVALSLVVSSNTKMGRSGDCNGDSLINAGDISALTLEIKDMFKYGSNPLEVGKGDFNGSLGCDMNYDRVINAADISAQAYLK